MARRRNRRNSADAEAIEAIAGFVALAVVFFGFVIVAIIKLVVTIFIAICMAAMGAAVAYGCYRLGRAWWDRKIGIEAEVPRIDWPTTVQRIALPKLEIIPYPFFPDKRRPCPDHIIGTSGSWKDVLQMIEGFPAFKTAAGPSDLKQRVETCRKEREAIQATAIQSADKITDEQRSQLECRLIQLKAAPQATEKRISAQLNHMAWNMERMKDGGFWDRRRAARLNRIHSENLIRLCKTIHDIKDVARAEEQAIQEFLNPATRAERIKSQLDADLQALRGIITSNQFAGAVAEVDAIDNLARLPVDCRIINDLKLEAPHYIHNRGQPIQSAQIDSLAITPAGVFVIEVKNWSKNFATSCEGFSPYVQVNRASTLIRVIRQEAHITAKVRSIVAALGKRPEKGEAMVAVKGVHQLAGYIQWFQTAAVDVLAVAREIERQAQ